MTYRLAEEKDLEDIRNMYREIIRETERLGRPIWGGNYPVDFLHVDVEERRMYVLEEDGRIVAALALCRPLWDDSMVEWEDRNAEARYIERLATRPSHWRKGLGCKLMELAEKTARDEGASYMRLFVIESNKPAYSLYERLGYHQIGGETAIPIDEHFTLHTDVMEKKIN